MLAAVFYLIGAVLGAISFFVIPPRFGYNLTGLAVGFIGAGLFFDKMAIGG